MVRSRTNIGSAGRPPYIKPKPVYDDGSLIGKDNGQMLDARWVLPFIFGLIIGFGICLTIF